MLSVIGFFFVCCPFHNGCLYKIILSLIWIVGSCACGFLISEGIAVRLCLWAWLTRQLSWSGSLGSFRNAHALNLLMWGDKIIFFGSEAWGLRSFAYTRFDLAIRGSFMIVLFRGMDCAGGGRDLFRAL